MPTLSRRLLADLARDVYTATGLRPYLMDLQGHTDPRHDPVGSLLVKARKARLVALHESIATGEPAFFDLIPGLTNWLVALEHKRIIHGALVAGDVFSTDALIMSESQLTALVGLGAPRTMAHEYLSSRPVMPPSEIQRAARYLHQTFYERSGWQAIQMEENRLRTLQQKQIAQAVEDQRKQGLTSAYPFEKERILLSRIRGGDQAGARRVLNEMLGAMYLSSPKLVVLRARAIEMMGYLTRTAVEDSPVLESLISRNHRWMELLIRAHDFEELSRVLTQALDDFIEGIYLHGFNHSNSHVSSALDFITRHSSETINLAAVARAAGLSPYRLAHVVKAHTGKTVLQLIDHARIRHACQLLEETGKPCAEIAYQVGFHDQSYFIRHFKRLMGDTPARFRRSSRRSPRKPLPP